MHSWYTTVDVNSDVAAYIEDQYSDETGIETALSDAIGDSLDELQRLCEDLDGTIGEDHLADCIALRHCELADSAEV